MIKPKLHYLYSPDLFDLEHTEPTDPKHFQILIQAMMGTENELEGTESFDFVVCTPSYLKESLESGKLDYLFMRHYLIVSQYDFNLIKSSLENLYKNKIFLNWADFAAYFSRFGQWEFEDYKN